MTTLPNYLYAADNHNIGNTQTSWLSPESWATKFGNAGKLAATSILSGANSFYNSAVTVGNILGAGWKENDTQAWISAIDSDLGSYYRQNTETSDLLGFIAGTLIPGLGGVKLLHMGQSALMTAKTSGQLGGNLGKTLGLLTPNTDKYVKLAASEINASVGATKLLNANTVQAIGRGFWQNTLEAAAFETVVQATMFKSPILEDQDIADIATNIAVGGVLGGVIGGAFNTAKIRGALKSAVKEEDIRRFPFVSRPANIQEITPESDRIIQFAFDSDNAIKPARNQLVGVDGEVVQNTFAVDKTIYADKIRKNSNDIRNSINNLAGKDIELGNQFADIMAPHIGETGYSQRYFETFNGALHITRTNVSTPIEIQTAKQIAKGETPDKLIDLRFVKLLGEETGNVLESPPVLTFLGDLYQGKQAVLGAARDYGFKATKLWDATKLSGPKAHLEGEARHIWASHLLKEIPDGTMIHRSDIPLLERAYKDSKLDIKIVSGEGPTLSTVVPTSRQELYNILKESKIDTANELLLQMSYKKGMPVEQGTEAAAKIVNTRKSYLEGTHSPSEIDDLFAIQTDNANYIKLLRDKGQTVGEDVVGVEFRPKYAKVVYDIDKVADTPDTITDAIVYFKEQQKLYEEGAKRVFAKNVGISHTAFPDLGLDKLKYVSRVDETAGLFSSANANYGTLASSMTYIGKQTNSLIRNARKEISDTLESSLVALRDNPEAAIEFEGINQKMTRSGKLWKRHTDENFNKEYIVTKESLARYTDKATGELDLAALQSDLPDQIIEISNKETAKFLDDWKSISSKRTNAWNEIHAQRGHTNNKDADIIRPIRPDLNQYKHFAFVRDPRVNGSGHMTMIHAASEKELVALRNKVPPEYEVLFKSEIEEFKRARHEYEYSRTLNENYINSDLANKGVFSNFFPKSDPGKIVDDILQQAYRESDVLTRELVRLRYEPIMNSLEDLGKTYSKAETSQFASRSELIEKTSDNPYFNLIKTALDISKAPENHLIYNFNKLLDQGVSKAVGAYHAAFGKAKSPEDLDAINALLDKHALKPAFYTAALQIHANHTAPKGELTKFVRSANSLLSLFTLGLDPLNALNNAIGSNILRMTELRHLTKAIKAGDQNIAGELANIAQVKLPGVDASILAPTKLVAKALSNFYKDDGTLMAAYRADGIIYDRAEQLKLLIDDFTLKGTESVSDLQKRINTGFSRAKAIFDSDNSAYKKGEQLSLNKFAEEFNRFISANVMDQITDISRKAGLMTEAEAKAYRNTFVNRVEGNITASQRPTVFQGPIGQAVSLFQSYQFNLLQQLFRYTAEGSKKDLAMLFGLQSTMYGIQSLPAFQFINTHIVGKLSGNQEHKDVYDTVYGTVGRTAGDFFLYGVPSNIINTNIYSRGDINPRQITILPTSLQEIPIVQGWGKFFGSIYETVGKVNGGGNFWESFLQGVEHNGVSRPLAGFAQTLQGLPSGTVYSTSSQGSILYSNDLLSLATLSRLAGGRPLDEAIANDAMYRVRTYEAARKASLRKLSEAVKTTVIGDETATDEQMAAFAQRYAELGGKQSGWNKYMMNLYKSANVSQAETIAASLSNPFSYKMQLLMGGDDE